MTGREGVMSSVLEAFYSLLRPNIILMLSGIKALFDLSSIFYELFVALFYEQASSSKVVNILVKLALEVGDCLLQLVS